MRSSPGWASMSLPSIVTVTVVFFGAPAASDMQRLRGSVDDGPTVLDVVLELVPEQLDGGGERRGRRRAEYADRRLPRWPGEPGADVVGHVEQQVEVARAAV